MGDMQNSYIFEVASCLHRKIIELLSWEKEAMVFEMEIDICTPRDIQPIAVLHLCNYFQQEVS